jgi:hypothetical protein
MSEATIPATPFTGWHRPNRRSQWRRICDGATWKECYQRLMACTRGQSGGTCVLPQGRHPERRDES